MVQCCAEEVTATIVKEMREAQMFAIMADEARDGKREQLSLCVRYVTGGMIKERFLALTELMGFDAESIANTIEQQLALNGIGDLKCVAQTYDGLHLYLQKENIDLARAMEYKNAVTDSLKEKRSDSTAGELHARALAICDANKLVVSDESSKQRRKTKRMVDYVVESTCGAGAGSEATSSSNADDLKQRLLFPCLDRMLAELEKRFSDVSEELLCGIQACSPNSEQFLSVPLLSALALHYNIDLVMVMVMVASNFFKRKNETGGDVEDMLAVYKQLDADMFPTLKATVQAALTIPVSSCSCERSFSALRRLRNWLRRTMGQNRLHHLAVMSIEKELLDSISPDIVIDRFANLKVRRHRLVLPK
ncbi:zinc finger MYM-type protein 1-like [Astyanax mexicanus]|uniref:Zinc finger MYM-type protein 1-like n=1 Tax=Astyanax mexicanus TaxID=7994 RepID=A0A8T2L069_ASTMX|nr:zinc finger MYM-type protein 1-like [Astyanax mexicanus]